MSDVKISPVELFFRNIVQRYDQEKYWRYRAIVVDPEKGSRLGDMVRLYYIKRADAFNNASIGTHRNQGRFLPSLPDSPMGSTESLFPTML